jgi:RNA polymerase sigma-70 factor (ECF subfamily)
LSINEIEIVKACKQNQSQGQRLLYITYAPVLKGLCYRYIKDRDKANDVLQDAFVKIFKNIHKFDQEGSLEGWLKRVVVNTALDFLKAAKVKNEIELDDTFEIQNSSDSDENVVSRMMAAGFNKDMLMQILNEMTGPSGTVFNMFYIDELSHKEIAEMLQITEGNSRKLAFRAKEQVKEALILKLKPELI